MNEKDYIDVYEKEFNVATSTMSQDEIGRFEIMTFSTIESAIGHCLYYSTKPLDYWIDNVGEQSYFTKEQNEEIKEILKTFQQSEMQSISLYKTYLKQKLEIGDLTYKAFDCLISEWYEDFKAKGGNYITIINTLKQHVKRIENETNKEKELRVIKSWLKMNVE